MDELRRRIAELKGWKPLRYHGFVRICTPELIADMDKIFGPGWGKGVDWNDPEIDWDNIKNWPHDIAAAWELVEEMGNAYFVLCRTNSTNFSPAPWGETHWECRFYAPERGHRQGKTAPEAICRAWLAWKEAGK